MRIGEGSSLIKTKKKGKTYKEDISLTKVSLPD